MDITELLKRIESGYTLPTLSPVALRLIELASDENSSIDDMVKTIEKDPSLALRLLKLANSAFFASLQPCSTLRQAVIKIGFQRLRIMALSISLRDTFPMGKAGPLDYEKFWRTSLYRAIIAKSIAEHLKKINPDEAFISALLMEIGLLIFFDLFIKGKDEDVMLEPEPLDTLLTWEKEKYGLDHRQVGAVALKYWHFPESIITCQNVYEKPAIIEEELPLLVKLCALASSLSGILFHGSGEFNDIYREAYGYLGINQDIINEILIKTFDQVEEIGRNLRVEFNKEKDLLMIMGNANEALSRLSARLTKEIDADHQPCLPSFDSLQKKQDGDIVTHTLQAVAHEIRNPLLAVGGFARKLSASLDPASESGKYVHIILEEAMRLENALAEMTQKG
jgi:HD-like signal output (HDOD) protein